MTAKKKLGLLLGAALILTSFQNCSGNHLSSATLQSSGSEESLPPPTSSSISTVYKLGNPDLSVDPGQSATLAMHFFGIPMAQNYLVFVHFVSTGGAQMPFAADHSPSVATAVWSGNITYNQSITVPADTPAGVYSIRVGLYENAPPYTNRIELAPGNGVTVDNEKRYTVGTLTVKGVATNDPPANPPPSSASGPSGQDANAWSLVFSDEFDGTSLNASKWNDHVWYESSNPTKNYSVENGALYIWPQRDASGNFFNRTIDTDGKFETTYGYFEAEAKLPIGRGTWPAFWLYAHPGDARPEIDIMEAYSGGGSSSGWSDSNLHPTNFGMTLHKANADYSYHDVPYSHTSAEFIGPVDFSAAFHKYAAKWDSSGITFYLDGKQIGPKYSDSAGYYNRPMYLLLDLWFGSASGTPDGSTPTGKGNAYIVNYVRAWKAK